MARSETAGAGSGDGATSQHGAAVVPDPEARKRRLSEAATVRAVVWATRLVALLTIATAVFPGPRRIFGGPLRTSLGLPPTVGLAGIVVTLVAGVAVLLLATGLRRRKRRAWWLAVVTTAVLVVVNVLHVVDEHRGLVAAVGRVLN